MPLEPSRSFGLIGNEFFKKIYRNNLKKLSIRSGFTLFKEPEILSKSPNLTEIELETTVKNENAEPIPIEEIMVFFPNMKKFVISLSYFTIESFEKLLKFKFLNKLKSLEFLDDKHWIRSNFYVQENFDNDAEFDLTFHWDFRHLKNQLLPRVKEIINGWEKNKPKYFLL